MRTLLAALLALTAWLAVRGEAPPTPFDRARPAFRSWGIEEGLPSDTPYALMLDSRGRLWAGTQEGLAVLGGKGWARVPFPQEATSSFVRAMLEDRSGAYWFGTQDDGLWRLDRGRWTHFRGGKELPSHRINALIQLGDGQILAGTWGAGVHRFDQGRWVPLDLPEGAGELNVWKLRETRDPVQGGRLWVCAQTGLWTRGSRGWSRMGAETGLLPGGVNDLVEMARPDGSRTLWAACWGRGVAAFEGDRWRYQGPAEGFPSPNPTSLAVTRDLQGNPTLWAGTFDGGIATLQEGRWRSILGLALFVV